MRKVVLLLTITLLTINGYGQMGEWTWMNGDSTANYVGHYGTQGVFASLNTPPGLYEACEWTDKDGNFWLFGGVNNTSLYSDLWKFNPIANQWAWIKGPGIVNQIGNYGTITIPSNSNNPGARSYGMMTFVDTAGNLWMYGGWGYDVNGNLGSLDELWQYDINSNIWTWMKGANIINQSAVYGSIGIYNNTNNPGGREESNASWTDNNNNLWLFGGEVSQTSHSTLSDLWKYNISLNQWVWIKGPNINNQIGIYGTKGIPDSLNNPSARSCYSKWKDDQGNFWLFGGVKSYPNFLVHDNMNDLWRYNPSQNEWTWIDGESTLNDSTIASGMCVAGINNIPSARFENRACWINKCNNLIQFGGSSNWDGNFSLNDLWDYNINSNEWTWMKGSVTNNDTGSYGTVLVSATSNLPPGRTGSLGWTDSLGNLWMYGGSNLINNVLNVYNDMWRFVPDSTCPIFCSSHEGIPQSITPPPAITLYPNPNNGTFTLSYHLNQLGFRNYQLGITDVTGRTLYSLSLSNLEGQETLTLPLSSGIYFWQMLNDTAIIGNGKVVVIK